MECKSAEYWISLYLDGILDNATEELLFNHIKTCEHCSAYLEQSKEMHKLTKELFEKESVEGIPSSAKIMEDIYKENMAFKKRRLRVKPVVMAAVFALAIILVPVNSKTVLAHGIDLARRLIIRQPGLVIMVEDKDIKRTYQPTGGTIIYPKVDIKSLKTPEEVLDVAYQAEKKPCLPEYMVGGYEFDHAIYGKHNDNTGDDFYVTSYYIKQEGSSESLEYISVNLNYKKPGIYLGGFKFPISDNETPKEITAGGEKGLLIISNEDSGFRTYKAHFILTKQAAKLEITYKSKTEASSVEAEIVNIAEPLLQRIKKEVPDNRGEVKNVSKVFESNNMEEFNDKIAGLDDRIVKPNSIPEGYEFTRGIFIDNPKKIDAFSLPSYYHAAYAKEDTRLDISMQLYTHTEKDSDYETQNFGEIVQRESLAGYVMKVYKETINSRSISVDMPDYAASVTLRSGSPDGQVMDDQEMKIILTSIINDIKQKAAKRPTLNLGRKIKVYDSLQQLVNSEEIKEDGLVIPSYIPENCNFYNAKYVDNGYLLQFSKRLQKSNLEKRIQPIISIEMRKSDMPYSNPFIDEKDVKDITVGGRSAYIFTQHPNSRTNISTKQIMLQVDLIDEELSLTISEMLNSDEEANETELIKIAESILKQIK